MKRTYGIAFSCAIGWMLGTLGVVWGQGRLGETQAAAVAETTLTPLELKVVPTTICIGVQWNVRGDANANATGTLEFRESGADAWRSALALRRTPLRRNATVRSMGGLERWGKKMREYALKH